MHPGGYRVVAAAVRGLARDWRDAREAEGRRLEAGWPQRCGTWVRIPVSPPAFRESRNFRYSSVRRVRPRAESDPWIAQLAEQAVDNRQVLRSNRSPRTNTAPRWCSGSTGVSKTLGGSSILSRGAKIMEACRSPVERRRLESGWASGPQRFESSRFRQTDGE